MLRIFLFHSLSPNTMLFLLAFSSIACVFLCSSFSLSRSCFNATHSILSCLLIAPLVDINTCTYLHYCIELRCIHTIHLFHRLQTSIELLDWRMGVSNFQLCMLGRCFHHTTSLYAATLLSASYLFARCFGAYSFSASKLVHSVVPSRHGNDEVISY